jgi:integrase
MSRRTLNDRLVKSLRPAKSGARYETWDSVVPGFGVRTNDRGEKTYILMARIAGAKQPARRKVGDVGAVSLADAREKARGWLKLISAGRDPSVEEERARAAEQRKRANSFAAVCEDFFRDKLPGQRKGWEVERDIRKNFIPLWGAKPISEISEDDILAVIKAKARAAPTHTRNLFAYVKRLFKWARGQRAYGLTHSPCSDLSVTAIIGERVPRDRLLSDEEVFAFWRAARRLPYPYNAIYQLLALTGLRLNEVARASWPEFHPAVVRALRQRQDGTAINWAAFKLDQLIWTIPSARMKGRNSKARAFVVPLTSAILAILEELPLFPGPFLFSFSAGKSPVNVGERIKKTLDRKMLRSLKALARRRDDDDPFRVRLKGWVNHDLRRVVRSGLSRLRVPEEIREQVLAHVRPGIKQVYDVYDYLDEKRNALIAWQTLLRSVVEPTEPPDNVVPIRKGAAAS